MQNLKVTLIQAKLAWEDIESNLAGFDQTIDSVMEETHLIVLPEMFSTGFSMNAETLAQDMGGSAVKWLRSKSRQKQVDIVGSVMIKEDEKHFNRLLWVKPEGEIFVYDKKHLFRFAGEEKVYSAGDKNIIVDLHGWKISPFICYDLRFPIWTRNIANRYDIAIFVANWPEKRSLHWNTLLVARAIENQCYVIGVNRVGTDGNGLSYSGYSSVIDPSGKILFQKSYEECVYTANLPYFPVQEYREEFPAWKDADNEMIKIPY
jgi:predicted amidohydrolase